MIRKFSIIIILCCLTVNLLTAQEAKELIIDKSYYAATMGSVLRDLSRSYKLHIDFDLNDVKGMHVMSKHYQMTLNDFLETIFKDTDIHYKIVEDHIQIRKKDVALSLKDKVYERKTDFTLSGDVVNKETGEALAFAQIIIRGTNIGTTCNVDGYFTLFHIPSDTSELIVSYVGYKKSTVILSPRKVNNKLVIELLSESQQLEDVTVVGERKDLMQLSEKISLATITPKEIAALPSLGEKDIFRTFQLLPGISGSNEGSAGLYVRGGTPDQNLILYDGFTVYHVDHLFGMFSTFNSNAVMDVQLYKGGFESQYGGRLSSVMDIVGKDGNDKNFNLGADLSFLSINAFTEFPIGEKMTFLFAFRRSFQSALYNKFFDNFSNTESTQTSTTSPAGGRPGRQMTSSEPQSFFYDLNGKLSYKPNNKDILSLSFFNGKDILDNSRETNRSFGGNESNGEINDLTDWGNWGSSLKWSRKWNNKFYSNALVSYSKYFSLRDRLSENTRINDDDEYVTSIRGTLEDNNLQDYSFKIDNELNLGINNHVEFGLQANYFDISYKYSRDDTIVIQDRNDLGTLFAFYLQDNWKPFPGLSVTPGVRISYFSETNKQYIEPRLSASYSVTENFKLKAACGTYYQFVQRIIREDIQTGSKDFWMMADGENIPVSSSQQYIAGFSYETNDYLFDVEAYYKKLNNLTEYTLRYIPQFGSTDYDEFYYEGDGFSHGIEFLAQKKYGDLSGWLSYTLGEVIYEFPVYGDDAFPASHDVTHEFKAVGIYKWNDWTFSATWIYATGKPYTEPLGGYQIDLPDGTTQDFILVGPKNGSRYPDYHRLDIAVTKNVKFGDLGLGSLSFSLFNVYNKQNVWYKEFELEDGDLIETDVTLLGITPNITLSYKIR